MSVEFDGLEQLSRDLQEHARLEDVKTVVKQSGAELNDATISNMSTVYVKGYSKQNNKNNTKFELTNGNLTAEQTTETDHIYYNEYGTRFMEAEPAIKPAFEQVSPKFIQRLRKIAGG